MRSLLTLPGLLIAAAAQHQQLAFWNHDGSDPIDVFEIRSSGLNTFANVPFANCFEHESSKTATYDIAVLGAPHDTVLSTPPLLTPYAPLQHLTCLALPFDRPQLAGPELATALPASAPAAAAKLKATASTQVATLSTPGPPSSTAAMRQ